MKEQLNELVPRVYRFALRLTGDPHMAEDLTQETMLRAWRGLNRLRSQRAASVWVFRITANIWRDHQRRKKRSRLVVMDDEMAERSIAPDQLVAQQESVGRAREAMKTLPQRQQQVLFLQAFEGLRVAEIAEVLQIGPGAVKASLSLARKRMRRQLRDLLPDMTECERGKIE